ncbi:MAG TPA: YceI family protein [Bacteroidetes bacterium]|nr:YceI family protein [Bacteroidota bacterium]
MISKILLSLLLTISIGFLQPIKAANGGELLIFVQTKDHPVSKDFVENVLPQIRKVAAQQDLEIKVKDISDGVPEMITSTPAIVFQNHLGRSLYIGRYKLLNKIKTFIRTVKRLPQQQVDNVKHDVLVWENECATIYTPAKITPLAGAIPNGFDQEKFIQDALKALDQGMDVYALHKEFNAKRNFRAMYMAFYPYLSEDGKLSVSTEMYSQFNCVIPIYKRFETPFEGSWADWKAAFAAAGKAMQEELKLQLVNLENGDAMLPVSRKTKIVAWETIGLPLPLPPKGGNMQVASNIKLGRKWKMDGPIASDVPVVNFSFMAPVDYYSGELTKLLGELTLGKGNLLTGSVASFAVDMSTLTMGDPSLDHHLADLILLADHPEAKYTFKSVESVNNPQLNFGSLSQFTVAGEIEFMGIKVPLDVVAQIEPILNEAGQARLQVFCSFNMRLQQNFGLEGPDGPQPAADTMVFLLNFLLKPAA